MMIEWLRNFSQRKGRVTIIVACVPLLLAGMFTFAHFLPPPAPDWPLASYMDEENSEITTRPANEFPPLIGASGRPTIVRAIYLTPSDPEHRFLAYLEKYDEKALAKIKLQSAPSNGPAAIIPALHEGILIRLPKKGAPWLEANAPEGAKLMDSIYHPSANSPALRLCPP